MLELRIALRLLRGGLRELRLFLACLVMGVTVIAAVGILAGRVEAGIRTEARTLLGGDVEVSIANGDATYDQRDFMRQYGKVSLTVGIRGMASFGEDSALVEIKGVDADYPLLGHVELESAQSLAKALGQRQVVIGKDLSERLGVKPGSHIALGDADFTVSDILAREPDRVAGAFALGAHVIVATDDLVRTGLLMPGSLIRYNYHVLLADAGGLQRFKQDLAQQFPKASWIVKTPAESNQTMQRLVERLQLFMTLAGLSSLLIGGVGILNATEAYMARQSSTIATFKALGGTRRAVFAAYVAVLAIVTLAGLAASAAAGLLLAYVFLPYLSAFFPLSPDDAGDIVALLQAGAFGALTVFTFSLPALSRGVEARPALLFRTRDLQGDFGAGSAQAKLALFPGAALMALVVACSAEKGIALGFIVVALLCIGVFAMAAKLVSFAAGRLRLPSGRLRLAAANLHRPAAPLFSMMLGIGISLAVLVALLLVEGNVQRDIGESIPAQAPSLFLFDIQPPQRKPFADFLAGKQGVTDIRTETMVRGRIAKLNGVPVEKVSVSKDAAWATQNDRGLSFSAAPPPGTRIAEGEWWSADYKGTPLCSLDKALAAGMNLRIGDTITLSILGEEVTARIANLRDVNYLSLRINFALILSPGALEKFPASDITTLHLASGQKEGPMIHALAQAFPNVSAVSIHDALAQLSELVGHVSTAIRITALFSFVSGVMVLMSALIATLQRRAYDVAMFKVLGARRRDILSVFVLEWAVVGCITALIASLFGVLGASLIIKQLQWVEFRLLYGVIAETVLVALACVLGCGLLLHTRAFSLKASAILRNE